MPGEGVVCSLPKKEQLSLEKLLGEYEKSRYIKISEILELKGLGYKDGYNPSKPFEYNGETYIGIRVEPRWDEYGSQVVFFKREEKSWCKSEDLPILPNSQDPFVTEIDNELIIGCVEVYRSNGRIDYKTVYRDENFEKIAEIEGMKCVRVVELPNKEIGVFLRPKGSKYGRGKICYTVINSLEELNNVNLDEAELVEGVLPEGTWGGINDVYPGKEKLYVLGHIAHFSEKENKNYYCTIFEFDPETKKAGSPKIVVTRNDFPKLPAKREPELYNVVYPGGFSVEGRKIEIYLGISDAYAGKVTIQNPFECFSAI